MREVEETYSQEVHGTPSCTKKIPIIWVKMIPFEKLIKQYYPIHDLPFGLTLRIFYDTRELAIIVINNYTTLTNILMDSQS